MLVDDTVKEFGSIDILVNNAGTIRRAPAAEHSEEFWNTVIDTNLNAVWFLSQYAGRLMLAQGHGKIINTASLLSFQGGILVPGYAAAKGAVAQLTKALANEWADKGINVNAIAPGYMATDNTTALRADAARSAAILSRIPMGAGGCLRTWPARRCFLPRRQATTCRATCWWWTADGFAGEASRGTWTAQGDGSVCIKDEKHD